MTTGEPWGYFVLSGVVGLITTALGVFLALFVQRTLERRKERVAKMKALHSVEDSTSAAYYARDWAHAISTSLQQSRAPFLSNSVGSAEALHAMAETPGMPDWLRTELITLAGYVTRLHLVIDPCVQSGRPLPAAQTPDVLREATLVGDVSQSLIESARRQYASML